MQAFMYRIQLIVYISFSLIKRILFKTIIFLRKRKYQLIPNKKNEKSFLIN